jgi:ABC-2 type transport system permease protein
MIIATFVVEWRRWLRSNVATVAMICFFLLSMTSILLSAKQYAHWQSQSMQAAQEADRQWQAQPDRHPHRVVHFGDFVFQTTHPYARFDPGILSYTGTSLYLEGHRSNTANFSDAGPAGELLRFEALSPANMVQNVLPLLLILMGFGNVARERRSGTLSLVTNLSSAPSSWLLAKVLSLLSLAMLLSMPIWIDLLWHSSIHDWPRLSALIGLHFGYFLLWSLLIVLVSGGCRHERVALALLMSLWMLWTFVAPRLLLSLAEWRFPQSTMAADQMRVEMRVAAIGNSHNPNDPHFAQFKADTLAKYGKTRVEDLPVNFGGLVMLEGERLTTSVFTEQAQQLQRALSSQSAWVQQFAWLNPLLSVQRASRSAAGSDLESHLYFLNAAEVRRYALVQRLNHIHAEQIRFENDREQRVSRDAFVSISRDPIATIPWVWPTRAMTIVAAWLILPMILLWTLRRWLVRP